MPASDVTAIELTVGATPSTLWFAWFATALWVSVAALPTLSTIVPPFSSSLFADTEIPSPSASPASTT